MTGFDGFGRWLSDEAPHDSVESLFRAFCPELVRRGLPVWRASLGLEVLHPEVSGWQHVWTDETLSMREAPRATAALSPDYLRSPTKVVDETDETFRRRLNAPCPDMPLLEELRGQGATDYVMFPFPFLDRSRTAVVSYATRRPEGFSQGEIDGLALISRELGPYLERHVLRRIAADLLDTYVGPRTGRRIIEGRVDRGAYDTIEAALWFADLRGFTRLSETESIATVMACLNAWFGLMGEVIEAHEGEVLKFIGDGALAILPTSPVRSPARACRQAIQAARDFCTRVDAYNDAAGLDGRLPLAFGLSLHFGEVAYGNIGASHRLDFTVIGPAVNRASRLQELTKTLDRRVLISGAVAQSIAEPLVDLGRHRLRDVAEPEPVFTLP
jgi:adenylate cyclase